MQRSIGLAVLVLATLACVPALAGHGHHHHCHGPHWSFGLSLGPALYPRPVYYAPPPVTYVYPAPSVQYVAPAPAPAYVAPTLNAPAAANWTSRTEPQSNVLPASQKVTSTVTIRNPVNSGGPVAFVIDDSSEVTLTAGRTQTLTNKSSYTVEFDRGGDFGTARKTLTGGAYEFTVTDSGWDLVATGRVASRPSVKKNALPDLR